MQKTDIHDIITLMFDRKFTEGLKRIGKHRAGTSMPHKNRNMTVLFSLIASMTIGALVLMALDRGNPVQGAYSLSGYLRLDPVENVVKNTLTRNPAKWDRVEVFYSRTDSGNAEDLALLITLAYGKQTDFHFIVGNGSGADDGQVQAGDFWKQQYFCSGRDGLIRVCVIADGIADSVSDCQIQRTNDLVENLVRTFNISHENIRYPLNWRM